MGQAESNAADEPPVLRPCALVVVGPSGVGKGTLINKLMSTSSRFGFSCSHTTRAPRPGEKDGEHYHFTTREVFEAAIEKGEFLEHAHVHGNIYGTSVQSVKDVAAAGRCCVLDIDVQGARQVRQAGLPAVFVFIAPPSMDELESRLRGRATDSEEQIQTRLATAATEMESQGEDGLYDYILVNDNLDRTFAELATIASQALAGVTPDPPGAASAAFRVQQVASTSSDIAPSSVMVLGADTPLGEHLVAMWCSAQLGGRVVAVGEDSRRMERLQTDVLQGGMDPQRFLPIVADITKEAEALALPRIIAERWESAAADSVVVCAPSSESAVLKLGVAREEPILSCLARGLVGPIVAATACLPEQAGSRRLQVIVVVPPIANTLGWEGLIQKTLVEAFKQLAQEERERVMVRILNLGTGQTAEQLESVVQSLSAPLAANGGLWEVTL